MKNLYKKNPKNENPDKIISIIEKILDFDKGRGLKILTPKQMHQSLLTLSQVKAGNTSENLLIEIGLIIYCLYRAKNFTKKV